MCLSFVAGVDGLFHKQHEERTLWHCFHFFSCLHYLLLISFGWKGWLFRGGPARFPQLWSYYSSFMFLSVVARVEGLSHKDHDATSFWHCVHSFGCLSLFCKLDATTVHEINPKRNPQMDAPKFCKRTPNTWLWGTPIKNIKNTSLSGGLIFLMFLKQLKTLKTLKTQASWGINVFNVFNSKITGLNSRILEPLCF